MKCKWWIWLLWLALPAPAVGQMVRLWSDNSGRSLALDLDRIWCYNRYEQSRFGLGLQLTLPPRRANGSETSLSAYGGYGLFDQQWKYGAKAELKMPQSRHSSRVWISLFHDYETAGDRQIYSPHLTQFSQLSAFFQQMKSEQTAAAAGYGWRWGTSRWETEGRVYRGGRLFDSIGTCYRNQGFVPTEEDGAEVRVRLYHPRGFAANLTLGRTWPEKKNVARLLVASQTEWDCAPLMLHLNVQAGITPRNTPYTRMFDLGGTAGALLYFENSLLCVPPSVLTANLFVLTNVRLRTRHEVVHWWSPQWQIGSHIVPFVGANGAWGTLWGADSKGQLRYEHLRLQAPVKGVAEGVVGADGLLRWGAVDWGAAFAWSLTPTETTVGQKPYWVMVTARIVIDPWESHKNL